MLLVTKCYCAYFPILLSPQCVANLTILSNLMERSGILFLVCISIRNDVEHLLLCLRAICIFCDLSVPIFCLFLKALVFSYWFVRVLHEFIKLAHVLWCVNIFFLVISCFCFLLWRIYFYFYWSNLSVFYGFWVVRHK